MANQTTLQLVHCMDETITTRNGDWATHLWWKARVAQFHVADWLCFALIGLAQPESAKRDLFQAASS